MAATKHPLADEQRGDTLRPVKKSRLGGVEDSAEKQRLKKEKKERKEKRREKKEKKRKEQSENGEDGSTILEVDSAAAEKLKRAEKLSKKEKKTKETVAKDMIIDPEEPVPTFIVETSSERKSKKEKHKSQPSSKTKSGLHYTQTLALSDRPQSEIDIFLSTQEINITDPEGPVSLRPVIEFHYLPSTNLLEKRPSPFANYTVPTPIQAASWPFTLSGRDAIGVAETGSGKTMAFALPCVEAVSAVGKKGVKAVIVSPTRELAMQTHEQLEALGKLVGLRCVCIYGGASKDDQKNLLRRGADIIVATPGRLKDFMSDDTVDLSGASFVVLDEADRMLDTGFEEDIKQILGACRPREERKTLMFTATWPQSVQAIASTFMVSPVKITIGSGGRETSSGAVELQANNRITQKVEVVDGRDKEFRLMQILKEHQQGKHKNDRILVFCLYKKEATRVEGFLSRKGVRVGGIHGDLRQEQRTRSLEAFKTGQTPVLVATDVAARGLDIPEVKLVINLTVRFSVHPFFTSPPLIRICSSHSQSKTTFTALVGPVALARRERPLRFSHSRTRLTLGL